MFKAFRDVIFIIIILSIYKFSELSIIQSATMLTQKMDRFLNKLKNWAEKYVITCSDEKIFHQDQKVNQRNDRWLCEKPLGVLRVMHIKFTASIMVF